MVSHSSIRESSPVYLASLDCAAEAKLIDFNILVAITAGPLKMRLLTGSRQQGLRKLEK